MITPEHVLDELQRGHVGNQNGVHIKPLTKALCNDARPSDERRVRLAVTVLRDMGHPICAHPTQGYFYAASAAELNDTCQFLYARAMSSLKQVAALKKRALPNLAGQLGLEQTEATKH